MSAAPTPPRAAEAQPVAGRRGAGPTAGPLARLPETAARWAWHLTTTAALAASPVLLVSDLGRGRGAGPLLERLGRSPLLPDHPAWIHSASVGELSVAVPLIAALEAAAPEMPIALSTMTATGRSAAARLTPRLAAPPFHVPADAAACVSMALSRLKPRALICVEAEIWPNLWRACTHRGIPVALVNGRISDRHFPRYLHARQLLAPVLREAGMLAMRTQEDAARILELGGRPDAVVVTGNLKFDAALALQDEPDLDWAVDAGLGSGPWLILASTAAGEEGPLLDAFTRLRRRWPELRCLLAPRRPERWDEVATIVQARNLALTRRSQRAAGESVPPGGILLLDSLGELARLYRHGTLVFVGGSLVPQGGQSLIEPAAAGKPVLFGPHVDNFRDAQDALNQSRGGQIVTIETFEATAGDLLGDDARRLAMGHAARDAVRASEGATRRTLDLLLPLLRSSSSLRSGASR